MFAYSRWIHCVFIAAVAAWASPAAAGPCSTISRSNLVACVEQASLERRAGQAAVRAADGRVRATDHWLPANPTVELTGARRWVTNASALNWSASLGVQLEIAGQRGARRTAAVAEREAQRSVVVAIERTTASEAFRLYFELLSARETRAVLEKLDAASKRVWEAAKAAAERGVAAGIEADVAEAAHLSVVRRELDAVREERTAAASLENLLGLAQTERLEVTGSLEPLTSAGYVQDRLVPPDSPEVLALSAEKRAALARASAFRRARVPSPTVSVFVQRDGFDENVVGLGLAFPLTLPEPIGRTSAGEVAENEALAERAALLAEKSRRTIRADLARVLATYAAAEQAIRAFSDERIARAEQTSESLASEVQAGRVSIRDAIVFQAPLLELMLGAIESRRALCLASVELVRAAGLPLDGSAR
jgi:cobalt-zinc-cadmium efflux system outer membrane protein